MKKWVVRKTPLLVIGILVLAGGAAAWWWHARRGPKLSLVTAVVKRGDLAATISATGTIEPLEVVDVGAQVAGRIISFGTDTEGKTIDYRSVVEQGAVLAKITTRFMPPSSRWRTRKWNRPRPAN
jgi:HlyD family secretion protein